MSVRMSNEMREICANITNVRKKLKQAIDDKNIEDCKKYKAELENLNTLYEAAEADFKAEFRDVIDFDDGDQGDDKASGGKSPVYNSKLFYKAISDRASLTDAERQIVAKATAEYRNSFSESQKENGGYTVPDDLSTEIFKSIENADSVRNLVAVENVNTATGTRIFKSGDKVKLYNTAEAEEIKELNNPKYGVVTYNQKKFTGISSVSSELLEDSFVNFTSEITEWLAEAARVTENEEVLYGAANEKHCQGIISTPDAFIDIAYPSTLTIEFLRKAKFTLRSGYRSNAKWIMNSDAFLAISELTDKNGRSYIQPDPREDEKYLLLGSQIYILDDILTEEDKTVVMYGDLSKAYRMFVRRNFGIAFTDIGAGAFETDTLKARGIERFDGKIMDNNALVIIRDFAVSPIGGEEPEVDFGAADTTELSQKNLSFLTKKQLLEIADELGVAGLSETSTKSTIISAIIAAASPDDDDESGLGI